MANKEELESLKVKRISMAILSEDSKECYGRRIPRNEEIADKVNELVYNFNKLLEVLSNAK